MKFLPLILLALTVPATAADKPQSLVRNGGLDSAAFWEAAPETVAEGGKPGKCLRFVAPGAASQDVLVAGGRGSLTVAVDVWVKYVGWLTRPHEGGYAYAAVCQTDLAGRIVAQNEFVRLVGTRPWQRYSHTFRLHPEAEFVSLRCGLSQALGEARFDNWTLVAGQQAKRLDEVRQPVLCPEQPGGAVAVLHEPGMAGHGAASSAENIARILGQVGAQTRLISAVQFADPEFFNVGRFDLLVLPTGRAFPADARPALIAFLHQGGSFIALGGYAFNDPLRKTDGRWTADDKLKPINTATGVPVDGLEVSREQIPVFDASFPLRRAQRLRTARGQCVVAASVEREGELSGWAASGVAGFDQARWIPLLETFDRYGRPRGAAAAMLLNYNGFYAGSCWAYSGVENVDLFADSEGPAAAALQETARFLLRKMFLHNLTADHRLYYPGEPVKAAVTVDNRGRQTRDVRVRFSVTEAGTSRVVATAERRVTVPAGARPCVEAVLPEFHATGDLYRLAATLLSDGRAIDEMLSGLVFRQPAVVAAAPQLRFAENYFSLGGRPTFLFGSDIFQTYEPAYENPWTWAEELRAARDIGVGIYENFQYVSPDIGPDYRVSDADWRSLLAVGQLTQKYGLVFMPGMLMATNVAVDDDALARQAAVCGGYAEHFGKFPALLYYVNGDYQLEPGRNRPAMTALWNGWLKQRYRTTGGLRAVWGQAAVTGELGDLDFPPPNSNRWDDAAAADFSRFQVWLMRRWNQAQVDAVRRGDPRHPVTSEYYPDSSHGAIDLPLTMEPLDVANFGIFEPPGRDFELLPLTLRFNDLRCRGKGLCLGEYGVKTHPAWSQENGAVRVHVRRTEQEQKRLFLTVGHYALGMGAAKVQNWSLYDPACWIFPWGLLHPNQLVPKDVAYVHRNQSLIWRHFRPRYAAPALTVCLPDQLRLGNDNRLGETVLYRTFADLLALHYDFNCLDDGHAGQISPATQVMIYPSPTAVGDEAYAALLAWVRGGGTLLLSGDFSYDANRQRTRPARLEELAGVKPSAVNFPHVERAKGRDEKAEFALPPLGPHSVRPAVNAAATSAEVLGKTAGGQPVLLRNRVGRGTVYFFADPIELADDGQAREVRRELYAAVLQAAGLAPLPIEPNQPWLHVMAQPTATGAVVHVVVNTRQGEGTQEVRLATAAGLVRLGTRNGWPVMAAVTHDGKVAAITTDAVAAVGRDPLASGSGLKSLLSLDGDDLRKSAAVLVAPYEPGAIELPPQPGKFVAIVGDFQDGQWTTREHSDLPDGSRRLTLDPDRATCLTVICRRGDEPRWCRQLTQILLRPEQVSGF